MFTIKLILDYMKFEHQISERREPITRRASAKIAKNGHYVLIGTC